MFPTKTTNALGFNETRKFDARWGGAISATDPNGVTTASAYDGFGRVQTITAADGTVTTHTYDYCNGILGDGTSCPGVFQDAVTVVARDGTQVAPTVKTYYDVLGRAVISDDQAFDGNWARTAKMFDVNGQVAQVSYPYESGSPIWTTLTYDGLERLTQTKYPDGSTDLVSYQGQSVVYTGRVNENGVVQTKTVFTDGNGNIAWSKDTSGSEMSFTYDGLNQRLSATDMADGSTTRWTYWQRGWVKTVASPDSGTSNFTSYDSLGELLSVTDANGNATTFTYDVLGRTTKRVETDLTSSWKYDQTGALGLLWTAAATGGSSITGDYLRTQSYDSLERPTSTTIQIGTASYTSIQGYDGEGRPNQTTSPSGDIVGTNYTTLGYLKNLTQGAPASGTAVWAPVSRDPDGLLTSATFGPNITQGHQYDPNTRRVSSIGTTVAVAPHNPFSLQNVYYSYDPAGNVTQRNDTVNNLNETYGVDGLNRLNAVYVNTGGTPTLTSSMQYAANGNLTSKNGSTYLYPQSGQPQPHAVTTIENPYFGNLPYAYDANGNMTNDNSAPFQYYSFNKVRGYTTNGINVTYSYGPEHDRIRMTSTANGVVTTTTYLPGADLVKDGAGNVTWHSYLTADGAEAGEIRNNQPVSGPSGAQIIYYFLDAQKSVIAVTDANGQAPVWPPSGAAPETDGYDAWGGRRNPDGSGPGFTTIVSAALRGYVNQYQLNNSFIDLNARYYDAGVARFMGADPLTGRNATDLQDWNGYSYAGNNPMAFSDPSGLCHGFLDCLFDVVTFNLPVIIRHNVWAGELFEVAIAAFCSPGGPVAEAGCAAGAASFVATVDGQPIGRVLEAGALTFAEAEAFNEVGNITGHGLLDVNSAAFYENVAGHALVGGTFSVIEGGRFGSGALAAGFSAAALPVLNSVGLYDKGQFALGLAESAAVGGAASTLGGGKFGNGALTGSFGYLFNEAACVSNSEGCALDFSAKNLARNASFLGVLFGGIYYAGAEAVALVGDIAIDALASEGNVTVGRFMSQDELSAMQETGQVQESFRTGITSVTLPPNPQGYLAAPSGDIFVEFDVPGSAIGAGPGPDGIAKIYGPNSLFGPRLGITQMPPASNITVPGH